MKNFTEWMMTKNFNYFFETKNPEKYINKKYHSFYLEQVLQPRFTRVDQLDIQNLNTLQERLGKKLLTPKDFYGKIDKVTIADMLRNYRSDPLKFQTDMRNLQQVDQSVDAQTKTMTMSKTSMGQQVAIIIMSPEGEQKFFNSNSIAQQVTMSGNHYAFIRQNGFEQLPTEQNPLGKLTQDGIKSMEHELGHAAQAKIPVQSFRSNNPQMDAYLYLTKGSELGTRLAMLKNLNSYKNIIERGRRYFKSNEFLNAFADNNKQNDRFNIIVSLLFDNDDGKSAIQQMINKYPDLQGADVNQISKTMESFIEFLRRTSDLDEMFIALDMAKRLGKAKEIRDKLIYGYPRVAFGNQPSGNQQNNMPMTGNQQGDTQTA
jgi:hypothetical protein